MDTASQRDWQMIRLDDYYSRANSQFAVSGFVVNDLAWGWNGTMAIMLRKDALARALANCERMSYDLAIKLALFRMPNPQIVSPKIFTNRGAISTLAPGRAQDMRTSFVLPQNKPAFR